MRMPGRRAAGTSPGPEFPCRRDDHGVIAEPLPARRELPSWFARLPGVDHDQLSATNDGATVKRCMPLLAAMTTGWIIPLAATVRLEIGDGGKHVEAGWEFDRQMVSNHGAFQVAGNPYEPRPPMKFRNDWTVRTAPGWSCLFVPPLNRPHDIVTVLSGIVDTATFPTPVNSRSSPSPPTASTCCRRARRSSRSSPSPAPTRRSVRPWSRVDR
ncbi:MAG: DUF6065 family protein [Actinomycetota bacterium]|nr:DUF6065 family protein [Actinomycetota bacterium]